MGESILSLSRDVEMRLNMGFESWLRVNKFFSWERERKELLNLFGLV
jgi:hypothetical protein